MTDTARTVRPNGGADRRGPVENPPAPPADRAPAASATWGGEDVRVPALVLAVLALIAVVLPPLSWRIDVFDPVGRTWSLLAIAAGELLLVAVGALAVLLVARRGSSMLVAAPLILTAGAVLARGATLLALGVLGDGLGTQGQMSGGYLTALSFSVYLPSALLVLAGLAALVLAVRHPVAPPATHSTRAASALTVGLLTVLSLMLLHGILEAVLLRGVGGDPSFMPLLPSFASALVLLAPALVLGGLLVGAATGPQRSAGVAALAALGGWWALLALLQLAQHLTSTTVTGPGDASLVLETLRQGLRTVGLAVAAGAGALAVAVALPSRRR